MSTSASPTVPQRSLLRTVTLGLALGALAAPWVGAQGVYRIVGPDGKVTYSDQPPPAEAKSAVVGGASGGPAAAANAPLPLELRTAVGRYPVTLYTSSDCAPCNTGRNLLNARGIPYTEKSVNSAEDVAALKRLSGETSLPFLSIGGQQIKGFSDTEWTQYLDAAGYPKQSILPTGYRRPAASPLVATQPASATATAPGAAQPQRTPAPPPAATPVAPPTGIRF